MARIALVGVWLLSLALPAAAQYPERPVTIVAGYPAGGMVDIVARQLAERMKATFAKGIVVVNRPRAGGSVAVLDAQAVRRP
jgi:tripartite-type tricarboxylate transporter receptor subunit TctC